MFSKEELILLIKHIECDMNFNKEVYKAFAKKRVEAMEKLLMLLKNMMINLEEENVNRTDNENEQR